MKTPRKMWAVVSRNARDVQMDGTRLAVAMEAEEDVFLCYKAAVRNRDERNRDALFGATDWRIETYVKGD